MRLVTIKLVAGIEVDLNTDNIQYIRPDPMDDKKTQIYLGSGYITVPGTKDEVIKQLTDAKPRTLYSVK